MPVQGDLFGRRVRSYARSTATAGATGIVFGVRHAGPEVTRWMTWHTTPRWREVVVMVGGRVGCTVTASSGPCFVTMPPGTWRVQVLVSERWTQAIEAAGERERHSIVTDDKGVRRLLIEELDVDVPPGAVVPIVASPTRTTPLPRLRRSRLRVLRPIAR